MKFETTVKQMKVYLREGIRTALGGVEDGDVLVWDVKTDHVHALIEGPDVQYVPTIVVTVKKKGSE